MSQPSASPRAAAPGACTHVQPADLARMAQEFCEKSGLDPENWEKSRFGIGEAVESPQFQSVYMEVERRGEHWVVVRLERRKTPLESHETGFAVLRGPGEPVP